VCVYVVVSGGECSALQCVAVCCSEVCVHVVVSGGKCVFTSEVCVYVVVS